jgi:RsiW-degrading membrane proteinase PrsW (M82 family)
MPTNDNNVRELMRHLLPLLILSLLFSCSDAKKAQYHYKKAVKFGLSIANDTIKINTIDSVAVIVNDTIRYEKFITTKDTIIQILEMPKTRYQTRIEYRYKTKILKQDVLKYKYIYKDAKKQKAKTNWMLLVWGFIIGVLLSFVTRLLLKLYL